MFITAGNRILNIFQNCVITICLPNHMFMLTVHKYNLKMIWHRKWNLLRRKKGRSGWVSNPRLRFTDKTRRSSQTTLIQRQNFNVETTVFQRWNNVDTTSKLQRWNNVKTSTLNQRCLSTLKQRREFQLLNPNINPTEIQRWNLTLFQRWFNVGVSAG